MSVQDLTTLMDNARERNKAANLSSILLSTDKYFLHLIEGQRVPVNALFNRISHDPKHSNCILLRYIEVKKREFADWNAEYVDISEFNAGDINLLLPTGELNIETLTSSQAVSMIRRIHAHLQVRSAKKQR